MYKNTCKGLSWVSVMLFLSIFSPFSNLTSFKCSLVDLLILTWIIGLKILFTMVIQSTIKSSSISGILCDNMTKDNSRTCYTTVQDRLECQSLVSNILKVIGIQLPNSQFNVSNMTSIIHIQRVIPVSTGFNFLCTRQLRK